MSSLVHPWLRGPSEKQIRESQRQAQRERYVRDMKDLAGVAYMGKNE